MSYRVLVTGSRDWSDWETLAGELDDIAVNVWKQLTPESPLIVVHGFCPSGADAMAHYWANGSAVALLGRELVRAEPHPADWEKYGKRAGPIRNAEMVKLGAAVCLAFCLPCSKPYCKESKPHDSHGTAHCASLAEAAGIRTERIRPVLTVIPQIPDLRPEVFGRELEDVSAWFDKSRQASQG